MEGSRGSAGADRPARAEALRLPDAHPDIVLLVTDLAMPEMDARRLARAALQRGPDLKVLATTGCTRSTILRSGTPFTVEALGGQFRAMPDG